MIVNWFSPLEPARTGIAQYSTMILPWLSKLGKVRVWTTQPEWDESLSRHAEVCTYRVDAMPWKELNEADLTFYHMGNNFEYHADIWLASMQYPGIVVMHDAFYPDFFNGVRSHMRDYPMDGRFGPRQRIHAGRALSPSNPYAGLHAVLEGAVAALVHSPAEFAKLQDELTCPLLLASFPFAAASEATLQSWSREQQQSGVKARLVTFGYLGENRRVETIVEVLAQFRSQLELHVHGPLKNRDTILKRIEALGLTDAVKISEGYVKDIDGALTHADLAINLRNPTMGEASLSQLQIWDHALPSIVSRTGWYQHLPEDTVLFVRPEAEREDLTVHLRAFLEDREGFARMGANGRRALIERHSPEEYARDLASLTEQTGGYQCNAAAQALATRAGEDMKRWLDPEYAGYTGRVAREIGEILG